MGHNQCPGGSGRIITRPYRGLCACGCGESVFSQYTTTKYIHGHNHRGDILPNWHKKILLNANIGKSRTPEYISRQSLKKKEEWANGVFSNRPVDKVSRLYGIPTVYKNIQTRSKIEARCAQLCDCYQILYQYEPNSIKISELNTTYTPDFYLPEFNVFLEVKGDDDSKCNGNIYKVQYLNQYKKYQIIIVRESEIKELERQLKIFNKYTEVDGKLTLNYSCCD